MKNIKYWLVSLSLSLLGLSTYLAAKPIGLPSGIFSLTKAGQPIPEPLLKHPDLNGIVVRGTWQTVEPSEGRYDWRYFDEQIARVAGAGKLASLVITSGGLATPEWLLDQDVEQFTFLDRNPFHRTAGDTLSIPLFWDDTFLSHKKRLIEAMGKRFADKPGLILVSAQCANATTDDWNIPRDIAQWRKVGYTSEKLISACKQIIDATMAAFPKQFVRMAIGRVPTALGDPPDKVAQAIIRYAHERYPNRFIVQRHNLSARTPDPRETRQLHGWGVLHGARPLIAAQMLWPAKDTRSCRLNGGQKPCQAREMLARAMDIGEAYGISYVEVYGVDVLNPDLAAIISGKTDISAKMGPLTISTAGNMTRHSQQASQGFKWVNNPGETNHPPTGKMFLPKGVKHTAFFSSAIGEKVGYSVFLPDSYRKSKKRYPVIYWLHGKNGNETRSTHLSQFLRNATEQGQIPETIMVFVNGGSGSFYSDSFDKRIMAESMIIDELIPHIDNSYRTISQREGRCLEGFSMGGFGALKFAAKYPDRFASVVSFGGALMDRNNPPGRHDADVYRTMFNNDLATFEINTPAYWFQKNREKMLATGLRIRIVSGQKDGTRHWNHNLHKILNDLGIPHEFIELEGIPHATRQYYMADHGRSFAFHGKTLANSNIN